MLPSKCSISLNARLFLGPTNITSIDYYLPKFNTSLNARVRAGPNDVHLGRSDCINKDKAKKNKVEEIKRLQNFAYTQEQLVDVFLEFLKSFEDFGSTEPCKQLLNIEIAVFLDAFIDRIETIDKNESDKLIAYQIANLISKADRFERQQKRARIEDITKQRNTEPQLPCYECDGTILITIK
ncbi:hypothetical protein F8M41_012745 [Gigaspora margarita]|uniref:Uncharacterized protein n=1 Tax=Gigaspora margarita TaxID=4874 RepID=A0A8H3WYI7_GIGMA|nr:hypothetical protein F8M41_012745 [Gigaspora margarita]